VRSDPGRRRARLVARVLLGLVATTILLLAAACPHAGRYLIIDDPIQPADAILVLAGARAERWLEAADLYREQMGRAVVLSPGIVEPAELKVRAMGVRFPAEAELVRDAMIQLGVPADAITILPRAVDNTADEAAETRPLAVARGWASLIVVTSKYHTRRTRFAFERAFAGTGIRVQVKGSRHDAAKPNGWWRSRSDLRFVVSELQKLVAYRLGLSR
jgi:uncharacterized SAM-binding protein YcdF (DUF218 family)